MFLQSKLPKTNVITVATVNKTPRDGAYNCAALVITTALGDDVGVRDGLDVGFFVGFLVGFFVGDVVLLVGFSVMGKVGDTVVGAIVGDEIGAYVADIPHSVTSYCVQKGAFNSKRDGSVYVAANAHSPPIVPFP